MAELVQNSIDANARRVSIERRRLRRGPCLAIIDDGEGIFPELDREDAHGGIGTESVLESFIEILSHCERNMREPVSLSQRPRENT